MKTPVLDRSSHRRYFIQKVVLKNFAKFTVQGLRNSCFPVNFAKFLRALFLQNISDACFWLDYLSDKVAGVQDTY